MSIPEQPLLDAVQLDEAWALVQRFATLERVSGSPDEATAAEYITERLAALGVPYTVHKPRLYLSLPREAVIRYSAPAVVAAARGDAITLQAKTPSFSLSTADSGPGDGSASGWLTAPALYVPAEPAAGIGDLFAGSGAAPGASSNLGGRIVVTEGLPMPARVRHLELAGAAGAVFVNPGERIHEAICTAVWGTPDLTTYDQRPRLTVAAVSRPDGQALRAAIDAAAAAGSRLELSISTSLDQGWYECPLVVAEIPGRSWPEEFVLLHGHLDSWHVGIGDNAVGNGAMLEIAHLLWEHRASLDRTVRIAWWPGHSTGRYAGSTWYADAFARDIYRNCIVHLNCDSPGCRWATTFNDLTVMAETTQLAAGSVADAAGLPIEAAMPERAGDLSFSNLGVSTLFMLSSTMSAADRAARGFHAVGGCGGNIGWHTEGDTLEIADRANLLRDTKVYALAVWRAANSVVHPLDYRATAYQLEMTLGALAEQLGFEFDLRPAQAAARELAEAVSAFYDDRVAAARADDARAELVAAVNAKLRRLGRVLVSLLYSQAGRYRQDPALPVAPLPELTAAARVLAAGEADQGFIETEVLRAQNRILGAVDDALELLAQ